MDKDQHQQKDEEEKMKQANKFEKFLRKFLKIDGYTYLLAQKKHYWISLIYININIQYYIIYLNKSKHFILIQQIDGLFGGEETRCLAAAVS